MKAKIFHLRSLDVIAEANTYLIKVIPNGKVKVTFSDAGGKLSQQRGLDWIWNGDVAKSGTGGEHWDTKQGVHLISKYMFAVPIFQRDDSFFSDLYDLYVAKWGGDRDRMLWFVQENVSTEKFSTSQMAEYLTDKKNFFGIKHGVNLTAPALRGLLD